MPDYYKVSDTEMTSVANKIRSKSGTQAQLEWPSEYMSAIDNISGGSATLIQKTITQNGTYSAQNDNADGYSQVIVNVSGGEIITTSIKANASYLLNLSFESYAEEVQQ